jgi:hypothetical protein
VTPNDTSLVNGKTYVWAGGGSTASPTTMVPNFDGAEVTVGGQLIFSAAGTMNPGAAGYGAFAAGDYLYSLGGANGVASVDTTNAPVNRPPGTLTFQSFNPGLSTPRVDVGATIQSGYFYILGGSGTAGTALNSTEFVLY